MPGNNRSKNIHLQNFQKVYDYRVGTLKDERQPLKDHLFNMDKHVKNMYKELLDEAGMNKKYDKDINEGIIEIEKLKKELVEKNNFVAFTRRLILVAEYVIPIHP